MRRAACILVLLTSAFLAAACLEGDPDPPTPAEAAVIRAAAFGEPAELTALLNADPSLATADGSGTNAIIGAARWGRDDNVALLLEFGADPEQADFNRRTPMHFAAQYGHYTIVRRLLDAGADPSPRDNTHFTPLHFAARHAWPETVAALIAAGAEVNARDDFGNTPLLDAAAGAQSSAFYREEGSDPWLTVAQQLLDAGADVSIRTRDGTTILAYAALFGSPEMVGLIASSGGDVNFRDENGYPLTRAAGATRPDVVKVLLELGATPDVRDSGGETPLRLAVRRGDFLQAESLAVLNHLLDSGADPDFAAEKKAGGGTALHGAVIDGRTDMIRALIRAGADVDARDQHGRTPLHLAAGAHERAAAQVLLDAGADPNATSNSDTPLSLAWSDDEMQSLLLSHGARE
ncbi:MAG: ankyrin repeat domain-containing protein [Dehalococcoidia bacterium]